MDHRTLAKVLFPTDLSLASEIAFKFITQMSQQWNTEIVILHVFEELSPSKESLLKREVGNEKLQAIYAGKFGQARDALIGKKHYYIEHREKSNKAPAELRISEKIVTGENVAAQICKIALLEKCDVIVMVSHKRSSIEKLIGASIVHKVIDKSSLPVLVYPIDV